MHFKRTTQAVQRDKNEQERCSYGRDRGRRRRYVSFVEILVKSQEGFMASSAMGESDAYMAATGALFAGMLFMAALDVLARRPRGRSEGAGPSRSRP